MNQEKFNEIVGKFKEARDCNDEPLNMHYLLVKENDKCFIHSFDGREEKSDIRSISKTVMALVAGIIKDLALEGRYPKFDEETYIYPIIKDLISLENKDNEKYLEKIKVKHLLTHTIGFDEVLMMREDIKGIDPQEYVNYIVNSPIVHEPGEYYLYSNAGMYLLAVVLEEFLGEDLLGFMDRNLFKPLDIVDYEWEKYGNYLAGATRLWLFPEDLLKIGKLMMNKGVYKGKTIVSKDWLNRMVKVYIRTKEVDSPELTFRRYGYGYGIWLAKDDFYFGHGTDGQILAVLPEKNSIVLTQAYQKDIRPIEKIVDEIIGGL